MGKGRRQDPFRGMEKHDFLRHEETPDSLAEPIELSFMGIAFDRSKSPYRYYEHVHRTHEVVFVDRGTYRCVLNDTEIVLPRGHALLVCPGDTHQDICEPPLQYYTLWFGVKHAVHGSRFEQIRMLRSGVGPHDQSMKADRATFWHLLEQIMSENETSDEYSWSVQNALALQCFWMLLRSMPRDALNPLIPEGSRKERLRFQLYRVFERFAGQPTSVNEMASALNMSGSSLAHRCRSELGMTPARAFNEYRIARACRMLRQTDMSVKEVSAKTGFSDACHFVHVFRSVMDVTPTQYRKA